MNDQYLVYKGKAVAVLSGNTIEERILITARHMMDNGDTNPSSSDYSIADAPPPVPHLWDVPGVPWPLQPYNKDWLLPKAFFGLDCSNIPIQGYLLNQHPWNGWATPAFELETFVMWYMRAFDAMYDFRVTVDDRRRQLHITLWMGEDVPEEYQAFPYETVDGLKWLLPIGAGSWCWDELSEEDMAKMAEAEAKLQRGEME